MTQPKIEFKIDPRTFKMSLDIDGKAFDIPEGWIIKRDPKPRDQIKRYAKLGIEAHLFIKDPIERRRVYIKEYRILQREKKNALQRRYYHSPRGQATTKAYVRKNKARINNWRNDNYDPDARRAYYQKQKLLKK